MVKWFMDMNFNETFNDRGEKARFVYRHNPLIVHSYDIFEYQEDKTSYEPIGEYVLIDIEEPQDITEKKLINMMSLMNGKKNLIDFKSLTDERVLFNIVSEADESSKQKVVFRTYNGQGVSKENAVLTINRGYFDD